MSTMRTDYLGDTLPEGYRQWVCSECLAACTFEVMHLCRGNGDCGFDVDKPESNHGHFAFIVPTVKKCKYNARDNDQRPVKNLTKETPRCP